MCDVKQSEKRMLFGLILCVSEETMCDVKIRFSVSLYPRKIGF